MRDTSDTSYFRGIARVGIKALPLAIMLAGMAPMQAMADEVCNSKIWVSGVEGPEYFFVGDELLLKANIGADLIKDNARPGSPDGEEPYIDFTGLGYGLDCGGGHYEDGGGCYPTGYPDYPPENRGHDLEFIGVTDSDCRTTDGATPTDWPTPEAENIVSIPARNGPVRLTYKVKEGKGETCSVDMKFRVNALHESTNWVVQGLGVPFYAGDGPEDDMIGRCSNGLLATEYGKTVFFVNTCDIEIDKQVSLDGQNWSDAAAAFDGDDVYYRVVVRNIGTAPLVGDVIVNDLQLGVTDMPVDAGGLKPGQTLIIDGGLVQNFTFQAACETETSTVNTAGVEAWCRVADDVYPAVTDSMEDTASLSCAPRPPAIELVKTADPLVYSQVQELIDYSFQVTNTGSVPLTAVDVVDPLPGLSDVSCPQTQLAVSETMTCTATYSITQADMDATVVNNTATATGTAPDGAKVSDDSSASISTIPMYKLGLVKTADPMFYEGAQEEISYEYELTNIGNQTLYTPYGVVDNKTTVQCPAVPASLVPGASVICTATYLTTVDDVNARSVTNVATGSALNAATGGTPVFSNEDEETVVYRGIELTATDLCVNDAPWAQYDFDVFGISGYQPSQVTYTWVNVDDPNNEIVVGGPTQFTADSGYLLWPGAAVTPNVIPTTAPTGPADPTWPMPTAWPGWELVNGVWIESDVPETPQLVLRVSINPTDEFVVDYPPATPNCIAAPEPVITVEKSVDSVTPVGAGSVDVKYTVKVTNSGGQKGTYDLVDTLMVDEAFTPASVQSQVAYVAGSENETTGDIKTPAAADFVSGATLVTGEELDVGMNESFTVTLRFSIDELLLSAEGSNCNPEDDQGSNTGFTNQVDVLVDGKIVDEAEDCDGYPLDPAVSIEKQILDTDGEVDFWNNADTPQTAPVRKYPSGAVYQVIVTNTGIVDLTDLVVTDPTLGLTYEVPGVLLAGDSVTINEFTDGAEVLNQEEATVCDDSGDFDNTASVNGKGVIEGKPVSASNVAYLSCVGTPDLLVLKEICVEDDCGADSDNWLDATKEDGKELVPAGPVPTPSGALYRITVENIGQVDLVDVVVTDSRLTDPFEVGDMKVGDIIVLTEAEWPLLRFDNNPDTENLAACNSPGTHRNIATATGTSGELEGDEISRMDDANIQCIGTPMISILKEVSLDDGGTWEDADNAPYPDAIVGAGDTALYRFKVTNTSQTVTLYDVTVTDTVLGMTAPDLDIEIGTLIPGQTFIIVPPGYVGDQDKADARMARADICATEGDKPNQAFARGFSIAGEEASADDTASVSCYADPAIQIVKEVSATGAPGTYFDVVNALIPSDAYYRFTVKNVGNVALENVTVSDPMLFGDGVSYDVQDLAVGEEVVITELYDGGAPTNLMYVEELCTLEGEYPNTATVAAKAVGSPKEVDASDDALLICEVPVDICADNGKPTNLKLLYNGTPESNNNQDSARAEPEDAELPLTASTVEIHSCNGDAQFDSCNKLEGTWTNVSVGESRTILGSWANSGSLLSNIVIKIFDGEDEKQRIFFHGSCSEPLFVGDKHGGFTIIGYSY
jgi:uncharacterized repeat protein (TIGR01451 family)